MGRIDIRTFGGLLPSVDPRELPDGAAQRAKNLEMRYGDFRPVRGPGPAVVQVPVGTRSIFRTPSGVWLDSPNDVNYVNGQINDAASERVYLTGRSEYPEAWENGVYRRLGVPSPTAPPALLVDAVDQFSTEEREAAGNLIAGQILDALAANRSAVYLGGDTPTDAGTFSAIWLEHGDDSELPTTAATQIAYCSPYSGGTTTAPSDAYLIDPILGGKKITYTTDYWAVPMAWKAVGYVIDTVNLAAALRSIRKPPENADQLIPDATCDEIAARIATLYSATVDPVLSSLTTLNMLHGDALVQVLRTDVSGARANALATVLGRLKAQVQAIEAYYVSLNANSTGAISAILADYTFLVPEGVTILSETRAYIYTYVTDWGEESAPSDASELVTLDQNDSVQVTIATPTGGAPYGTLVAWRLYRSSTSNAGASYQFVTETTFVRDVDGNVTGGTNFTDIKLQEELQEPCETLTWIEPPAGLKGLIGLPNGIMVGFVDKTLHFCEPYHPYAWPEEYQQIVEHTIVALGFFGQTVVVLTEGTPCYASGADSASMSVQKQESTQACVSKRGVVSAEGGVIYPSPDGICIAGPGGVVVVTQGAYSKEDWQALGLEGSFAAFSEGVYYLVTENEIP